MDVLVLLVVVVIDKGTCAALSGSVLALAATALGVSTGESSLCEGKYVDGCGCSGSSDVLRVVGRDRGSSIIIVSK